MDALLPVCTSKVKLGVVSELAQARADLVAPAHQNLKLDGRGQDLEGQAWPRLRRDRTFKHIPGPWGPLALCAVPDRSGTAAQPKERHLFYVCLGLCAQALQ